MAETTLTHPTYKFVDEKDADAIAWAFIDKDTIKKLPFKFPEIKPHEIRAQVTYTGLCLTDHCVCHGDHFPMTYPICPGHEIVGIVSHLGSDVKDFKIGDRVGFGTSREFCGSCEYCSQNYTQLCRGPCEQTMTFIGGKYWGGWATSIQHPAQCYFKLPQDLPEEKIAPLFCAGITCYNPVAKYAKPGQNVAVLGIGGLGHMAVQYAKAWGCNVTAWTTSLEKEDFIKKLGADQVLINNPENLQKEFEKFHLVINTLPAQDDLDALVMLTKPLGVFCQVGAPAKKTPFNPSVLAQGNLNYVGSNSGSVDDVRKMLEFSAKHKIFPLCEQFDWEDFPKALDRMVNGKPIFRCVVDVRNAVKLKKN